MKNWKRTFAVIWTGQFLSLLTSYTVNFAILLWVTFETGSAEMLAYGTIAALLPLRSIGSAFHMPAMQASVPLLAPESQLTRVAGINQVIAFVHIPDPERTNTEEPHVFREMREGAMAVLGSRGLSIVFLFSIIATFFLLPVSAFAGFAALTAVGGVTGAVYQSAFTALVQTRVDPVALGRVFSLYFSLSLIPSLLGIVGIGFFADSLGVTTSFVVCGAVIAAAGIVAFFFRSTFAIDR